MNPEINHEIPFEEREYTSSYRFKLEYLHPRHWPLWCLIGLLFIIGRLPFSWVIALGRKIGHILIRIGGSRVKVTRRNLELCFPEKSAEAREQLLRKNFEAIGIALVEPGIAWFSSRRRIERIGRFIGWSRVLKAQDSGRGVLVNALHMTCVEMACRIAAERFSFNILYRVHDNPVYEYVSGVRRNSYRHKARFIPRKQVKDLLYFLKKGEVGIILPDQDMGRKRSLFLPFFGIEAATIPSTSDFARLSDSQVVFGSYCLDEQGKYLVEFSSPLRNMPSGDHCEDTRRLNQLTEDFIRSYPDQYLWQHRRFKTRPEGESPLYSKEEKKKKKR